MASEPLTEDEEAELLAYELKEYIDARGMTTDKEVTLEELAAHLIEIGYRRGKK
jgi:hypothetical protein